MNTTWVMMNTNYIWPKETYYVEKKKTVEKIKEDKKKKIEKILWPYLWSLIQGTWIAKIGKQKNISIYPMWYVQIGGKFWSPAFFHRFLAKDWSGACVWLYASSAINTHTVTPKWRTRCVYQYLGVKKPCVIMVYNTRSPIKHITN